MLGNATLRWTSLPSRGRRVVEILPSCSSCYAYGNGYNLRPDWLLVVLISSKLEKVDEWRSFREFFFFLYSSVCQSHIGKKGGKQLLSLGSGCKNRGHVTHELMHALGFFHEHTRPDRDKFVKILWNNIKSGNPCRLRYKL